MGRRRRVRQRRHWLAAVVCLLATVGSLFLLYGLEYAYPATASGDAAAAEVYSGGGTRLLGAAERGGMRFVAYARETGNGTGRGVVRLERGWNGRYRPAESWEQAASLSAGVQPLTLLTDGGPLFALLGDGCAGIARFQVTCYDGTGSRSAPAAQGFDVPSESFLRLLDAAELEAALSLPAGTAGPMTRLETTALLDADGTDVTAQYTLEDSGLWSGGRRSAVPAQLYLCLALTALAGLLAVAYCLQRR